MTAAADVLAFGSMRAQSFGGRLPPRFSPSLLVCVFVSFFVWLFVSLCLVPVSLFALLGCDSLGLFECLLES